MTSSIKHIPGIGSFPAAWWEDLIDLETGGDGLFSVGRDGVKRILTPLDRKCEFVSFSDKTLAYVKSAMGHPALYPLREPEFKKPAKAVLMDLDGTSVHSEGFWIWIIEQSIARTLGEPKFELEPEDEPHVSGHSVSEHLQYCIDKYCPDKTVEEVRRNYFDLTRYEMNEILEGRGRHDAFTPSPNLKTFLETLKKKGVRISLVTSGLYEKAWPEILSVFRTLGMGDPLEFYDAIITAGTAFGAKSTGTLGELSPKPHPWLYAEAARVGLGLTTEDASRTVGVEDSGAGVVSIRLAGFAALGVEGGNIRRSGTRPFLHALKPDLMSILDELV